jgi:diguanylate cyclase (GGDEF)-like protein
MGHHRVLVADRNATFLEKTSEILSAAQLQMIPVDNGTRVLSICRHEKPEAVLIHVDLPGLPGTEVCQRLKTQLDPSLPVALMFGEETSSVPDLAARCLADNYLIRPLKRTELLFCVRSLLQLRTLLQEKASLIPLGAREGLKRTSMVSLEVFHTFLALEIRRVDRYGFPLALIAIAVDRLPESAGAWSTALDNQLGPALAEAMRSSLRDIDVTTVLSHREMLALMPHTDTEGARNAAERIRSIIAAQSYHFGRTRIQPSVSVGVACLHGESIQPEELLTRVNVLKARAADSGGNCVLVG